MRAFGQTFAIIGVLAAALVGAEARATEGGRTEFPIGADTALPSLLPPPGETTLLNYTQFYTSTQLNGNDGTKIPLPFKLTVFAEAPKFVHTWVNIDGVDIGSGLVQPVVNTDVTIIPGLIAGNDFTLADTDVLPLMFHVNVGGGLHLAADTNIWLPDGHYDVTNPASQGLNRTTVGQQFSLTWLPSPKIDTSVMTLIEFGSTNSKTNYYSGSYVDTEFNAGYHFFDDLPKLELGVQGYYMSQFENDTQNGVVVNGGTGNKGMAVAIGPQITYYAWDHGGIILKYQHELVADNRPIGDKIWVEFALPL